MKFATPIALLFTLATIIGCNASPQGGGASHDEGFRIIAPTMATSMRQGEVQTITLKLIRGDYFKQDVKLKLETTKGISVDPSSVTIKAAEEPVANIRVSVDKNAALGDYRVTVTGTPSEGMPTTATFTVSVVAP